METIKIEDVTYKAVKQSDKYQGNCTGCVFSDGHLSSHCSKYSSEYKCSTNDLIFIQVDSNTEKFSKDVILAVLQQYCMTEYVPSYEGYGLEDASVKILYEILNKPDPKDDPDYEKYLELKKKFENM